MKILVVGSGGREHAIVWRLAQDAERHELFCAPGNAGIASLATCVALKGDDVAGIVAWAKEMKPDLVVVGPEADAALAEQVTQAKRDGLIDAFLFCSASDSYLAAVMDSL